ncbi:MAG: efflux transporter outer membrane subunit [Gammaproteobacteria bacterium]|nr:efflux transporter outer membrane subunit [Gammaproteobacteria bacterium]
MSLLNKDDKVNRYLSLFRLFIMIGCFSLITSCMVGPNFKTPRAPAVHTYTEKPLPAKTVQTPSVGQAGKTQYFATGEDVPAAWWGLFHSTELNELVRMGLANSPNLSAAYATLRQSQEALNAQIGNSLFPAFNASFSGERQRASGTSSGAATTTLGAGSTASTISNIFNTSVNVSYTLDVFGGARREIESLRAQVDYQQFQLIAADMTLSANVMTTAITIASLQEQIRLTRQLLQAQQGQLAIMQKQFRLGGIAKEIILTQETLVAQTLASIPPLEKSLFQNQHALSVLVGKFPNAELPQIKLALIHLPTHLPVSLPSNLVRQRPDVRASEALLHAASASVGVATANLFPQFSLTGSYGSSASMPAKLFGGSTNLWSIAGQVTQPLFHGGALLAARRQAIAAYDQAAAQYRQVVLQAFQNVADTLQALETDARTLKAERNAEMAARKTFLLTQKQFRLGASNYLNLLNAQEQYLTSSVARIQAEAARYNDTVALFSALGGGWWHRAWCVKQ